MPSLVPGARISGRAKPMLMTYYVVAHTHLVLTLVVLIVVAALAWVVSRRL